MPPVLTEDLELVKGRDLAEEEKKQQKLFEERKGISISTTHCISKDMKKGTVDLDQFLDEWRGLRCTTLTI